MPLSLVRLSPQLPGASIFAGELPLETNPVPLISGSLKQASPLAREMLFWDSHLGRGYSRGERGSWRQPCTLGISCLTVLASFQLSGGNVFGFIPAKTRQHGREAVGGLFISLRWPESSQVFQWRLPVIGTAASDQRFSLPALMTHSNYPFSLCTV